MPEVVVKVDGKRFGGWKSASIKRSLEAISGAFELAVTDEWGEQASRWPINAGASAVVEIDGTPVITGYVDKVTSRLSKDSHEISISGRDKAADIVDCSVPPSPVKFKKQTLLQVAQTLAKGLGVTFSMDAPDSPVETFHTEDAERIFDAIERMARMKGLLLRSDGRGVVHFFRPAGMPGTGALIEGENILAASTEVDDSQRFSEYLVLAHESHEDGGWTQAESKNGAVQAKATDAGTTRTRRLVLKAESAATTAQAKERAQWEATVRAARALKISVTVQGWTTAAGTLWDIGTLATVRAPRLGIEGRFLVVGVQFSLGPSGTTTTLDLRRPDAFKPEPVVQKKSRDTKVPGWGQ